MNAALASSRTKIARQEGLLLRAVATRQSSRPPHALTAASYYAPLSTTPPRLMAMKPGTPIAGLDIFKDKDAPVALERSEYPEWVNTLAQPMVSLAKLRKMPLEEASDKDKKRYLKLVRRLKIKEMNEEAKAK